MGSGKKYGLFALVCAIFGTTFLAIRLGLEAGASPLFYASLRFLSAGILMTAGLFAAGRLSLRGARRLAARSVVLSLFLTVGTFGLMFLAQTRVDSGLMARLDAVGPLFTALFAALLLGKRLSAVHAAAFALGTAGTFLMAGPSAAASLPHLAAAAGSVVLYAAGNALYPRLFSREEDPVAVSALQTLAGGLVLFVLALLFEKPAFPAAALGPLLWLILAGSVVAHTATLILVREAGPVFASAWLYVAPAVATVAGFLVLDERVSLAGLAGTGLALAGVFAMDRAEGAVQPAARRRGKAAA